MYGTRDQEETSSITSQSNNQKVSETCVYVCMFVCVHMHAQTCSVSWTRPQLWRPMTLHHVEAWVPHLGWKLIEGLGNYQLLWYWAQFHGHSVQGWNRTAGLTVAPFSLGVWFNLILFVISDSIGYHPRSCLPWSETQCFIADIKSKSKYYCNNKNMALVEPRRDRESGKSSSKKKKKKE